MNTNEWKLPLNLAIGLHVLLVLAVIYIPNLFRSRPIHPEIYTVNLVNLAEPTPKTAPRQKPKAVSRKTPPEVKVKEVKIQVPQPVAKKAAVPTPIPPPTLTKKAVSLKPLKRKLARDPKYDELINNRIRKLQALEKRKELEKIHRIRLSESLRAQQKAEQEARIAAEELKQLLRSSSPAPQTNDNSTNQKTQSGTQNSSNNDSSAVEKQYFAAISNRVQQYWALPEMKTWDPSLTAIIWITINREGIIVSRHFEKGSGDKFFDQYVEKTLHDAVPLPRIPSALNKTEIEIGLRFKPTGIQ